jgi:hypothetical protein
LLSVAPDTGPCGVRLPGLVGRKLLPAPNVLVGCNSVAVVVLTAMAEGDPSQTSAPVSSMMRAVANSVHLAAALAGNGYPAPPR